MFFCKYKSSVIKTIIKKYKRKVILIVLFSFISIVGFSVFFVQKNIESIISKRFSQNTLINLNLSDVSISLNGKISLNNLLVSNKANDTVFYSKAVGVDPVSMIDALNNNDLKFNNISLTQGKIHVNLLNQILSTDSNLIVDNNSISIEKTLKNEVLIKKLSISDFDLENGDLISNAEILNMYYYNDSLSLEIEDLDSNINEYELKDFNSNVSYADNKLIFQNINTNINKSNFSGTLELHDFNDNNSLNYKGNIKSTNFYFSDFFNATNSISYQLIFDFEGNQNSIDFSDLEIISSSSSFDGFVKLDLDNNEINGISVDINKLKSSSTDLRKTYPGIFGDILPTSISDLGTFELSGYLKYSNNIIQSSFELLTDKGSITSDLNISDFGDIDNSKYEGIFIGKNLNLSKITGLPFLGFSDFNFNIDGRGFTNEYLNSSLEGNISSVEINNYKYKNINISGNISDKIFDGFLSIDEENINMDFSGSVNYNNDLIDFDFSSSIENANLSELNLSQKINNKLSGNIVTKLRGSNIKDLIGDVKFIDFNYSENELNYDFEELVAQSRVVEDKRIINITSPDAIDGILIGNFKSFNFLKNIYDSFISRYSNYQYLRNNDEISFNFNLKPKIAKIFSSDFSIQENTFLGGKIDDKTFELNFNSPGVSNNDIKLKNVNFKIEDEKSQLKIQEILSPFFNVSSFVLDTDFNDDSTNIDVNFISNNNINNININHSFNDQNQSIFRINEIIFDYNKNQWVLEKSFSKNKNLFISGKDFKQLTSFTIKSNNQKVELRYLDTNNEFEFLSNFDNVDFSSIFPKPKNIQYEGLVNGSIILNKINETYFGSSSLMINKFSGNNILIGNVNLNIKSNKGLDYYEMNMNVVKENNITLDLRGKFEIEDSDFPIDLDLKSKNFDISPFSAIGEDVLKNIEGLFNSNIQISGTLKKPELKGFIQANKSSFDVPYLGIGFSFLDNPKFIIDNYDIIIDKFSIEDKDLKTVGIMDGKISHNRFKDWFLDFEISSDNLLALNTERKDNEYYYGSGFIDGIAKFYGYGKDLDIDISGRSNLNTKISVPIKYGDGTSEISFLKFTNNSEDSVLNRGLELSLDLDLNENALIEIIFDENTNSRISGYGNGKIIINSDYSGAFALSGDFTAEKGYYYYKSLGFIERQFEINKGANIKWDGEPYSGVLSANASYEVPGGANPASLIQNTSFNRKIPTIVNISLEGELSNLNTPIFDLEFPETRGAVKSELDYYLSDYEKEQSQSLSLITQGIFINDFSQSLISSQTITNNLFQRASGIIDEIFTNPNDKMNIGINFSQGDRFAASSLLNRDRIGLTLQSEISDRILINGKIGVPVSGTEENVILGNVQVDFLLNDSGSLRARIFNKENEYQFFGDEVGFTQGLGLQFDVEFNNFSELIKKLKRNKKN